MKRSGMLVSVMLLFLPLFSLSQPGSSCSSPIPITMDSISRSYPISAATGGNVVCTSLGTSPITYFSLVANSSAQNMILKITGPNTGWVEVAFYNSTSCTNGNFEMASSICFYDGTGLWAPSQNFVITPNQTYILRIKTATTGSLTIQGYYYTPPNNSCATAMPIGTILTFDNNAAHKPAAGINPASVCAVNLTNTALYTYTVDYTGPTSISLENLVCDNNYQSDLLNLGFQVGIFKGSCAGLTNVTCFIAVPGTAQFSAGTQLAGTQMYVAINGILSSNCDYGIRAINAVLLAADLKYFTAFRSPNGNILKWVSLKEDENAFFEIQRSIDSRSFTTIDRVNGQVTSTTEKSYQVTDASPPPTCYYRLKLVDLNGKSTFSKTIRVDRKSDLLSKIKFQNIVTNQLSILVKDLNQENVSIKIIDPSGREERQQNTRLGRGENNITINTSRLSNGLHYLIFSTPEYKQAFPFIKL